MTPVELGLITVAVMTMIFSRLWLLKLAFGESIHWGLACIFTPFVPLYFTVTRWPKTKVPFLFRLAGWAILLVYAFTEYTH